MKKTRAWLATLLFTATVLAGCGENTEKIDASSTTAAKEAVPITQVTNWFAEPEHGGQYAALSEGFYKEAGIDMTILPGGPQISPVQIVASGQAQFGMVQADDILLARESGIPVVAVAAIFQKNPQALLYHKDAGVKDFSDLNGHSVFVAPGAGYWEYIKKAYKLDTVKEQAYTGSYAAFINDKGAVTQCYITSEPYSMKQQGIETEYLLIHDSGYQPYANVLFTTEKFLEENPELVKAYVAASIKGWNHYKEHYKEVNPVIQKENPDLTLESMIYGAEAQMELIFTEEAMQKGVGYMNEERWLTLQKQLLDLGIITKQEDIKRAFTTAYLPAVE